MRALSIDKLHAIAKSKQNFAVLLVRKFFSKEQLNGHSVFGGRKGKMALDRRLLERVKGIYYSFYPTNNKQDTWKRCATAINTFLREQVCKNKSLLCYSVYYHVAYNSCTNRFVFVISQPLHEEIQLATTLQYLQYESGIFIACESVVCQVYKRSL